MPGTQLVSRIALRGDRGHRDSILRLPGPVRGRIYPLQIVPRESCGYSITDCACREVTACPYYFRANSRTSPRKAVLRQSDRPNSLILLPGLRGVWHSHDRAPIRSHCELSCCRRRSFLRNQTKAQGTITALATPVLTA